MFEIFEILDEPLGGLPLAQLLQVRLFLKGFVTGVSLVVLRGMRRH